MFFGGKDTSTSLCEENTLLQKCFGDGGIGAKLVDHKVVGFQLSSCSYVISTKVPCVTLSIWTK